MRSGMNLSPREIYKIFETLCLHGLKELNPNSSLRTVPEVRAENFSIILRMERLLKQEISVILLDPGTEGP